MLEIFQTIFRKIQNAGTESVADTAPTQLQQFVKAVGDKHFQMLPSPAWVGNTTEQLFRAYQSEAASEDETCFLCFYKGIWFADLRIQKTSYDNGVVTTYFVLEDGPVEDDRFPRMDTEHLKEAAGFIRDILETYQQTMERYVFSLQQRTLEAIKLKFGTNELESSIQRFQQA